MSFLSHQHRYKNDQTLVEICNVAFMLARTFVRSNWDLYRSIPKVLGKCQMSDCYFIATLCVVLCTSLIFIHIHRENNTSHSNHYYIRMNVAHRKVAIYMYISTIFVTI